jgi:hypothetical protein
MSPNLKPPANGIRTVKDRKCGNCDHWWESFPTAPYGTCHCDRAEKRILRDRCDTCPHHKEISWHQ